MKLTNAGWPLASSAETLVPPENKYKFIIVLLKGTLPVRTGPPPMGPAAPAADTARTGRLPGGRCLGVRLAPAALAALLACGGNSAPPLQVELIPPASPLPAQGSKVVFQAQVTGGRAPVIQWYKDGQPIPGADGA